MFGLSMLVLAAAAEDPCALLHAVDIARVVGWTVERGVQRTYHLPAASGTMCTFAGHDGSVVVTIAARGDGIPLDDAAGGFEGLRQTSELHGIGMPAEIGASDVVVHHGVHDYGVSVQALNAPFGDVRALRELAQIVADRVRTPRTDVTRRIPRPS